MRFADFVCREAVIPDLQASDKEGVIQEMLEALQRCGAIKSEEAPSIFKAIMKREELGSTGLGRGVAVPHIKHPSVESLVGTVAVSHQGVDFAAMDGEPVHVFILLVSPPDRTAEHLRALENIIKQMRNDTFLRFLQQANTKEDILQVLDEADAGQFAT